MMRKVGLIAALLMLAMLCGASSEARAQGKARTGPDASTIRDAELEKDSLHNLEVARHYFKLKKAYVAAIKRCEEIIAGNPTFSRMDEVLFIAGESSLRLAENRGKQAPNLPADKLRDDAREYLSKLVQLYPQSSFRKQAESDLATVGGLKKIEEETAKP